MIKTKEAIPNPEYLIKSISEQGYSLETALADLIDNSISANADKIEILTDSNKEPFTLFLADNGEGMSEKELKASMLFPSKSPENKRDDTDLGRFGLGMKTASFSQTRRFTVLSRQKKSSKYSSCTWDVDYLKKQKSWLMIINSDKEIELLLQKYHQLSKNHLNEFDVFNANTIVVWQGLYKFEKYLDDDSKKTALNREITDVTSDYLSLVFHRFMEKSNNPLQIRINNIQIDSFNPFPIKESDFRSMEYKQKPFSNDSIRMEGFVLPSRSIDESRNGNSLWTTRNKGLMDMEGIYIYRSDRIIIFGGWNGLIKKAPRLQLARLRVEVGNGVDHLLHLNVAKSQVVIPHDLKKGFERYIDKLKTEAEREFYNRGVRRFPKKKKGNKTQLFERTASNKGTLLEINSDFPLLESFMDGLSKGKKSQLKLLIKMINTVVNNIRKTHEDKPFSGVEVEDGISTNDLKVTINKLIEMGISSKKIKDEMLSILGIQMSSIPDDIMELLHG